MPATLGSVNCYMVRGPAGVGLIDTGMNDATSLTALKRGLETMGMDLGSIDTVFCTHHHPDHCGIGLTLRRSGARVHMSGVDAGSMKAFLENPDMDWRRATFFGRHQVPQTFAERVTGMFPFFRGMQEPFEPGGIVQDGDVLDLGGIPFEVLITPGHTAGHGCLLHGGEGLIFTGDHIIPEDATHVSMREDVQGTDPLGGFITSPERGRGLGPIRAKARPRRCRRAAVPAVLRERATRVAACRLPPRGPGALQGTVHGNHRGQHPPVVARPAVPGFPRISSPSTTTVSAPMTIASE